MTYRITIDTLRGQRSQDFQTRPAARSYIARAVTAAGFESASVSGPDGAVLLDAENVGEWLREMTTRREER